MSFFFYSPKSFQYSGKGKCCDDGSVVFVDFKHINDVARSGCSPSFVIRDGFQMRAI